MYILPKKRVLLNVNFQKVFVYVNWQYLLNTFRHRSFSEQWINWIAKLLRGGKVNVMVNGHTTDYFECRKGVRQDDPLSPYLFILVADNLNKMIQLGIQSDYLSGLGPPIKNDKPIILVADNLFGFGFFWKKPCIEIYHKILVF